MGSSQSVPAMGAKVAVPAPPTAAPASNENRTSKPKPCCVCKEEKQQRDECMLFSKSDDPAADCKSLVEKYKACMATYGY